MDLEGSPVDTSQRLKISKELKLPQAAKTIKENGIPEAPEFILDGWKFVVIPTRRFG